MESYPEWPNVAAMMLGRAREWDARPMFRHWEDGAWVGTRWDGFALRAARLASGLRAAGIQPGDRVVLCSDRPEVVAAEVALMAFGAVTVPAYTSYQPTDHACLIKADSRRARAAIVSTPALAEQVEEGARLAGIPVRVFGMQAGAGEPLAGLKSRSAEPGALLREAERIPPEQLACLIYTRGTSGHPRGVMLPHRAMLSNFRGGLNWFGR